MALGGINSLMYNYNAMNNSLGQMSAVAKMFDYKSAQNETKSLLDTYKKDINTVNALKKETADFLTRYTQSMNSLSKAASKLTNGGVNKLLYDGSGAATKSTIQNTVDATKGLLTQYNDTLKLLNDNSGRGDGVLGQIARMEDDPAAREKLDELGISREEDGSLKLDEEKLASALSSDNPQQVRFLADLLGGSNGLAAGVQKDARAGLSTSAGSLVNRDVAKMQEVRENDPISTMYKSVRGGGAYALNNIAASGMLLNMLA